MKKFKISNLAFCLKFKDSSMCKKEKIFLSEKREEFIDNKKELLTKSMITSFLPTTKNHDFH